VGEVKAEGGMMEAKTAEATREYFRDRIPNLEECALCLGELDVEENKRGIVEFMDGCYWICNKCRKVVGKVLDMTQVEDYCETDIPPYYKKSRRHWLKYLEKEHQISISVT